MPKTLKDASRTFFSKKQVDQKTKAVYIFRTPSLGGGTFSSLSTLFGCQRFLKNVTLALRGKNNPAVKKG